MSALLHGCAVAGALGNEVGLQIVVEIFLTAADVISGRTEGGAEYAIDRLIVAAGEGKIASSFF